MTPNIWRVVVFVFGLLMILTGLLILALGHLQDDGASRPAPPASRVVQTGGT